MMWFLKKIYFFAVVAAFTVVLNASDNGSVCNPRKKYIKELTCRYNSTQCSISFKIGLCISCEPSSCDVVIGSCVFDTDVSSFYRADLKNGMMRITSPPPESCEELNNRTCGSMNREGFLCSQCKPGYGPAPYSSTVKCFNCTDSESTRRWLLYLALELVPSTVFYL